MIYASANAPFEAIATGAPEGLVGTITVEVFDPSDGSTIVAASTSGISEPRPGVYVAILTVPSAGTYAVLWTLPDGGTAVEELTVQVGPVPQPPGPVSDEMYPALDPPATAGEHYFTLDELRAEQDVPVEQYPDEQVEPNRELAEQTMEHISGVAWIPRRRVEQVRPQASGLVRLDGYPPRAVEAVQTNGSVWTPDQLLSVELDGRYLLGVYDDAIVTYTYGRDRPPMRVRRAVMIATRVWTTRGPVDDRATQVAADGATINLATPGLFDSLTGIPEFDAAARLYQRPTSLA